MKLGVCYNVFDCEELLESSIKSVRGSVEHVCVVYQLTSNFGQPANPHLLDFLEDLQSKGLVDTLISYTPRIFSVPEKRDMISRNARKEEVSCDASEVADQFFNELTKRELGRQDCLKHGMTHFLSMDCDEYYHSSELESAKQEITKYNYEATVCRMRIFGKFPTVEYIRDEINAVPFIHILAQDKPFKLCAPYPIIDNGRPIGLDPTRRVDNVNYALKAKVFQREEIEMYHMTLVRKDITKKLANVSNRQNYGQDLRGFLAKWEAWGRPEDVERLGILHPHPNIATYFSEWRVVPNYFGIDLNEMCRVCCKTREVLMRCSVCKTAKYCSAACQREDWTKHKSVCKPYQ